MASVAELTSYTGNKDLGLGGNADIPVSNAKPLEFTNTIIRDIQARDHQKQILKYQQQVQDRDKLYAALASGQIKVGDLLERDTPIVNQALEEQTKAFDEWMKKGYFDINGAMAYRRATQKANDTVTQAQARKYFFDKESGNIASEKIPRFSDARKKQLEKNLGNFWGDLTPFQETNRLSTDPIEKFSSPISEDFSDPAKPYEKGKRTYFSYDDTLKNAMEYSLEPEGLDNLQIFQETLSELPPVELLDKIKRVNSELQRYNTERGLTEQDGDYAPPIQVVQMPNGKLEINEPLDKLAAKFSLAGKQKYKTENFVVDEGALKIAKQKLDEIEAANLNRYRMGQLAIDRERLKFQKEQAAKIGVPQDVANSAKEYAVQLFNKLTKLAGPNGVISPENMKKLTSEELKYLGTANTIDNKFSISPLGDGYNISSMRITPEGMLEVVSSDGEGKNAVTNTIVIDPKQVAGNKLGDEMTLTTGKEGINYNSLISLYGSGSGAGSSTININDVPAGTKLEKKGGKYFYNGKEVIQ